MIVLDATTKSLEVLLAGAVATTNPDFVATYVDVTTTTYVPGNNSGATNGTTGVTAVAAPGASTQRQVKLLTVYNVDTAAVTLTVRLNNNSTMRILWKGALAVGEALTYADGIGFDVVAADGSRKISGPAVGSGSASVITPVSEQRMFRSGLEDMGTILTSSDKAYWVYVGYVTQATYVKYVEFYMTTSGAGTQAAEVALASSPNPPNKGNQTLTKLVADGTLSTLTATTTVIKRNTTDFAYTVPAGTHLWAGIRTAMATTQPTCRGLGWDMSQGHVLSTATAGTLTSGSSWTGAIIALSANAVAPDLRVVLD